MRPFTVSLALLLALSGFLSSADRTRVEAAGDGNSYFNALVARPDYWRSYSLRDPNQLKLPNQGGLLYSNTLWNPWSYDSTMDAAKATIGEFAGVPTNSLAAPLDASSTTVTFNGYPGDYAPDTSLRIDNETVQLTSYIDPTTKRASIRRGTRGSSASSHAAGAVSFLSTNSVKNMIILPLGTSDGSTYLFTWDSYWTDTNRFERSGNAYYKAWQFDNGGTWLEPRMRFTGGWGASTPSDFDPSRHVASTDFRSYNELGGTATWSQTNGNALGPIVQNTAPVEPMGPFAVTTNQWLRHWVLIEQRGNDYDYVSAWVADESRGPVQILNRTPVSVRPYGRNPNSIAKFWLELDTSQDTILTRQIGLPLISYHRNFVALLNPRDTTALMLRPLPGATPPPPGPTPYPNPTPNPGPTPNPQPGPSPAPGAPSAPQNLRVVPRPPM